jgi:hypothetical protein
MSSLMRLSVSDPLLQLASGCVVGLVLLAVSVQANNSRVLAQTPSACWEVVSVEPSRQIKHDVELKDRFDSQVVVTDLAGPRLFSHAVGIGEKSTADSATYLTWYSITRPTPETTRAISVRDELRGRDRYEVTLGKPAFLLSPAQRVTTGAPSDIPDSLNYFKAYAISRGEAVGRELTLNGAYGPQKRRVVKACYFCVPVDHWHHDDHTPIKRRERCFMVYELEQAEVEQKITTLDQFGLNRLNASASGWICVPARIVNEDS